MRFLTSDIKRAGRDAGPHHVWWRPRVSRGARHFHSYESALVLVLSCGNSLPRVVLRFWKRVVGPAPVTIPNYWAAETSAPPTIKNHS